MPKKFLKTACLPIENLICFLKTTQLIVCKALGCVGLASGRHSSGCFSHQQGAVGKFVVAWRSLIASVHVDEKVEVGCRTLWCLPTSRGSHGCPCDPCHVILLLQPSTLRYNNLNIHRKCLQNEEKMASA
jgi:hypothetical protein